MKLDLEGTVTLVTGGSDGLGQSLTERLAEEGGRVAFCGRNEERIRSIESRLVGDGAEILGVVADVTSPADLEAFAAAALARWGRIDGLVNNAGRAAAGAFETTSDDDWTYDIELKVMAAIRLTRLVLPTMRAAKRGSIVNVLNLGAKAPGAKSLPTAASRAAGLAITKALSKEFAPENVRVNAVMIGVIESGQHRRRAEATGVSEADLYVEHGRSIPLGRVGTGAEFADLVTYLLSERSSFVTGSAINLDGGASPVV